MATQNLDVGSLLSKVRPKTHKKSNIKDDMPASLRKMISLRAAAGGGGGGGSGGIRRGAPTPAERPTQDGGGATRDAGDVGALGYGRSVDGAASGQPAIEQSPQRKGQQQQQPSQAAATGKSLKQRKKDFLSRKKRKQQGKHSSSDDEAHADPERMMTARTKASLPAFGEQAEQPIKVNLKRRHWTEKTASDRCKEVFVRQLQNAKRRAALSLDDGTALAEPGRLRQPAPDAAARRELVDAYRQRKGTSDASTANMRSLAALVHGK